MVIHVFLIDFINCYKVCRCHLGGIKVVIGPHICTTKLTSDLLKIIKLYTSIHWTFIFELGEEI